MIQLERYPGNPILKPDPSHAWEAQNVSNTGAVIHDGRVHLLYRAEGFTPRHPQYVSWPQAVLGLAVSEDGVDFMRREAPVLMPDPREKGAQAVEDCRITRIDGVYYMVYVTTSCFHGDGLALATTRDFGTFQRHGPLMPHISQRGAALFPRKINGRYALLHRIMPSLWVSFSDDLATWSTPTCILSPDPNTWYNLKLGPGAPPIELEDTWFVIWHAKAMDEHAPHGMYRLGALWLDKQDPTRIVKFQREPILEVETEWERNGYYANVVYTCGAVEKDGYYLVYYGCADRCLAVASVPVDAVHP